MNETNDMRPEDWDLIEAVDRAVFLYTRCMADEHEELEKAIRKAEAEPTPENEVMVKAWREIIRMIEED